MKNTLLKNEINSMFKSYIAKKFKNKEVYFVDSKVKELNYSDGDSVLSLELNKAYSVTVVPIYDSINSYLNEIMDNACDVIGNDFKQLIINDRIDSIIIEIKPDVYLVKIIFSFNTLSVNKGCINMVSY